MMEETSPSTVEVKFARSIPSVLACVGQEALDTPPMEEEM